jgi:hypothetical protein
MLKIIFGLQEAIQYEYFIESERVSLKKDNNANR